MRFTRVSDVTSNMTDCRANPQQKSVVCRPGPSQSDNSLLLTRANTRPFTRSGLAARPEPAYSRTMQKKTCRVCLVEHDEEIHAATLSLRQWLREKVTRELFPQPPVEVDRPAA
jgi:hypothetical protein